MRKPEKKDYMGEICIKRFDPTINSAKIEYLGKGYNQACEEWNEWLKEVANVEDMTTFICNWFTENGFTLQVNFCAMEISKEPIKDLVKAISESILGKNEKIRS